MKTLLLTLSLIFSAFSFAQNRKSILKEIDTYKHQVCKNTSYQNSSNNQLLDLGTKYFMKNNYNLLEVSDSSLTFIKKTEVSATKTRDKVKHLIYLNILTINGLKKIALHDETVFYREPFTGVEPPKSRGTFYLDKKAFYKHMYFNLCGTDVEVSKKIYDKINLYNSQQTKEKKKLVSGRDF